MDAALLLTCAVAGAVAGVAAGALPGLHVNGVAAALLAFAPAAGAPGATFLVAALAASPFGLALSSTLVSGGGAAGEDEALPAEAFAREGRAVEACALLAWGAWTGLALALPLAFLLRGLLVPAAPLLARGMPWLLLVIVAALALSETKRIPLRRRLVVVPWPARALEGPLRRDPLRVGRTRVADPHRMLQEHVEGDVVRVQAEASWGSPSRWGGRAAALGVLLLSGGLGLAAFRLGAASPFGLPGSPLLPLLAGLFALPGLVRASRPAPRAAPRARLRAPTPPRGELLRVSAPGALASMMVGLAPGVSASHVALALPRARSPERALVQVGAVGGGAVVFTLLAWHVLGKARSGALVAADALAPRAAWPTWTPTPALLAEAALVLAAAGLACLLARGASAWLSRVPSPRPLALAGLAALALAVFACNGWLGLVVLGVAGLVGETPRAAGVRRSHAMGVILVPALLRAWGLA